MIIDEEINCIKILAILLSGAIYNIRTLHVPVKWGCANLGHVFSAGDLSLAVCADSVECLLQTTCSWLFRYFWQWAIHLFTHRLCLMTAGVKGPSCWLQIHRISHQWITSAGWTPPQCLERRGPRLDELFMWYCAACNNVFYLVVIPGLFVLGVSHWWSIINI